MTDLPYIHPNTPPRLIKAFKRAGYNQRELARRRQVNPYWVNRLIRHGEEPTNLAMRAALFLPKHPRANHTLKRQPLPQHIKWWRYTLDKQARSTIVERLYKHAQEINNAGRLNQ